jgi:hypothetical protein
MAMKDRVRLLRLALSVAAVDLAVSVGYWGAQGVPPARVLESIAGWVVEAGALAAPLVWLAGMMVLCAIYAAMVGVLALGLALRPVSPARWLPLGMLYGIGAYVACYQWLVPALIHPARLSASPMWMAACLGLHAVCFGPWMAWVVLGSTRAPVADAMDARRSAVWHGVGRLSANADGAARRQG